MSGTKQQQLWFPSALLLLFIALKLTGVIAWSWWWVMAPLWGPFALVLAAWLIFAICSAIAK